MDEAHRAAAAGRHQLARQRYESALYLLGPSSPPSLAATILRRVARTYLDDGDVSAGLDCLEAALAVAEGTGDPSEIAHTINAMANSSAQRGLLDEAEPLYHKAGHMARVADDQRLVAMTEQNLGILASMHGDDGLALRHHMASLAGYRALGLKEELGRQLSNLGLAHAKLGELHEAAAAYAEAKVVSESCGDRWTRLMVEVNDVALHIAKREFQEARAVCDWILTEAESLREGRLIAETYSHYGVIARELGDFENAERFLDQAFEGATAREDLLLGAETAREQAELYLLQGRNRDTLKALGLSHRLFTRLQARRDLADVSRRLRTLEQRFEDLVRHFAQDIESKDAYTLGHCQRVADLACAIAANYGYDQTNMFWFRVGALLHDVGKIVVPSDILNKPGPLAPEERAIMERHPVAGVELLNDVEFPWDVIPMIRGHHERWDGHGYPDGLAGEDIPLPARILGVADVYDALTSQRPYRKAFQVREALQLMQADSGRHFDPEVLSRFFRIAPVLPAAVPVPGDDVFGIAAPPRVTQPRALTS